MKKPVAVSMALVLVLFACGGDSAEESESTSPTEEGTEAETASPAADTTTTQPAASEAPVGSGEEGTGTATIGDMTWEFTTSGGSFPSMCDLDVNDSGIVFTLIMYGTDDAGREIALNMGGPLSGSDGLLVQVGSPTLEFERWTADGTVYDRLSGIEGMPEGIGATVQIDGNTVSGSGVFFDDTALTQSRGTGSYEAGVLEGTFSATCPPK